MECNAFLTEVEAKSGTVSSFWETKPNTQLLARLRNIGHGNMSFYTGTGTLLFQGKDAAQIRKCFVEWRAERMKRLEDEAVAMEKRLEEQEESQRELRISMSESDPPHAKRVKLLSTRCSACEHCHKPQQAHTTMDSQTFCRFNGRWECRKCRSHNNSWRTWYPTALKVQAHHPNSTEAFPEEYFPDCLKCQENYDVVLVESKLGSFGEERTTNRGHQHSLCQLCKRGQPCPRA